MTNLKHKAILIKDKLNNNNKTLIVCEYCGLMLPIKAYSLEEFKKLKCKERYPPLCKRAKG